MPVRASTIQLSGSPALYERPNHSGSSTRCFFCPHCGSRIYHRDASAGEFISLKAGTLDDTSGLTLVAHLWIGRKQPWVRIESGLPAFDAQPDDLAGWRAGLISDSDT